MKDCKLRKVTHLNGRVLDIKCKMESLCWSFWCPKGTNKPRDGIVGGAVLRLQREASLNKFPPQL